jgi:hypothetical protein
MKPDQCEHCGALLVPELMQCPHCQEPAPHPVPTDLRCECGFLLCKLTETTMEIKCRRCKRLVELPLENLPEVFVKHKEREQREPRRIEDARPDPRPRPDSRPRAARPPAEPRGQVCVACGQLKPSLVYGKCIECRTESIKVQYKSKMR